MRFVTAREANQAFSHILKQAEDGEAIVLPQ
jgi:antitoxin (DNA-binding transcriptional repressor) of toxin-antitoxin stability system